MRISRVKDKLARNEPALITTLHLTDPSLFEIASLMGFDGIWMDMEHHAYSVETAAQLMRAARVGVSDIIARPAKGEYMRMARMLEAGAQGIMYPRCDSAEEAAEVVRWAKFPPLGERGCDGANGDAPYCSMPLERYVYEANRQTFIVIQVEQAHAIDQAEAIAAVEGVDVVMLGPGDLSVLSNIPGQMDHPIILDAKNRVATAARNTGKQWGTTCGSMNEVSEILEMGARFVCYGADITIVLQGLERIQRECIPMGFTFENRLSAPNSQERMTCPANGSLRVDVPSISKRRPSVELT